MANPTQYAINLIQQYINTSVSGGYSNTNIYLTDFLNNPFYSGNPVPQKQIYTNYDATSIFEVVSASSVKNIVSSPSTIMPISILNINPHTETDVYLANAWAKAYYAADIFSLADYVAVTGVINTTMGDPMWQSGISWANATLKRPVDLSDIEMSR